MLPTTEKIDVEKLKVRDKINFYADVLLFEDELSDNGCSVLRAKIVSSRTEGGRVGERREQFTLAGRSWYVFPVDGEANISLSIKLLCQPKKSI